MDSMQQQLDQPDWRKVGEDDDVEYFKAVEELFGHLYGTMRR